MIKWWNYPEVPNDCWLSSHRLLASQYGLLRCCTLRGASANQKCTVVIREINRLSDDVKLWKHAALKLTKLQLACLCIYTMHFSLHTSLPWWWPCYDRKLGYLKAKYTLFWSIERRMHDSCIRMNYSVISNSDFKQNFLSPYHYCWIFNEVYWTDVGYDTGYDRQVVLRELWQVGRTVHGTCQLTGSSRRCVGSYGKLKQDKQTNDIITSSANIITTKYSINPLFREPKACYFWTMHIWAANMQKQENRHDTAD